MQVPFFSIITVCLNAGDYLLETIDSVLMQDFSTFEIIVKDGFSKDGSFEMVPNDIRILKVQQEDNGIYDAMNQGLNHATGQYVLFLNSGDFFFDSTILESFYKTIINNNFPGLVYCDYETTGLGEYIQSPPKLTNFFLFRTMLCHQVCMIKRELYVSLGNFDTTFKVDADYDFLLRMIIQNHISYKHFKKLGIISTSKGFSYTNQELAKEEAVLIRKRYFPKMLTIYNTLLFFTFPSLRKKIVNQPGMLYKTYQKLVNFINRLF